MRFEAGSAAITIDLDAPLRGADADFRTPVDPEAGWVHRNPDRAMLFFFVSPRDCGALDELMAL